MASNFFSFFEDRTNKCALPYVWHITSIIDFLKISVRIDDASDESSFKTLGVILSGPADLCGFKWWSSLATPFSVIWISGMV